MARLLAWGFVAALAATRASAQQARMYGTVSDEAGAGVANAKVILEPVDRGSRVEIISKGKKGSYLIGIIRPGRYALKVDAPGQALLTVKAEAVGPNDSGKKVSQWKIEGHVRPDKATEINIDDGMEITCDLVVGKAVEVTTATGEKANATADQAYALLAQQVQQGDCAGALPQLETFTTDNPTHAAAFYLKGYCYAVANRDDEAIAALAKSQELNVKFTGVNMLMGQIYMRGKHLPEAEAAFTKEIESATPGAAIPVDALLNLGSAQREQNKTAEAIATFEKAIAVAPTRPEAYIELSDLYAKAGQTDKAAAILEKSKEVGAEDPVSMLNVGISYFNKKDYAHAEAMFRRVIESKAGNADLAMAYGLLGKLQLRDGKNAEAIASFQKCLELDPKGRLAPETQDVLKALQAPKKK